MCKITKKIPLLLWLILFLTAIQSFSALAATLTIKVVIDNESEFPTEIAATSAQYSVKGVISTVNNGNYGFMPSNVNTQSFPIKHNQIYSRTFPNTCKSYWFEGNTYSDPHFSLESVEHTYNIIPYTYSPNGNLSNPNCVNPFNWVQPTNTNPNGSVTLHFKYNPDIDKVAGDPDPEVRYSKFIDYLGDSIANPDTSKNGENDYRLYLDLTTQEALEDNKADIIFILDTSGSMAYDFKGKSRMSVLKSTMTTAINSLTQNSHNRISLIQFASESEMIISNSTSKTALNNAINKLNPVGGTNYYQSFIKSAAEINQMIASDTEGREKVVIFITDGEPTFATPIVNTLSNNEYAGMIYACESITNLNGVDRFYSIFIGDSYASASTLQTITQRVSVNKEKYMVQAVDAQQLSNTLERFMAKVGNTLYNVTLIDELSSYVDYGGELKVTRSTGGGAPVLLAAGVDYSVLGGSKSVGIRLLNTTRPDSRYQMSFNVKSNDTAMDYFGQHQSYPAVGDANTDYPGNTTSSGRPGFFSNAAATLKYSFGGSGLGEKHYQKPVVQVVEAPPVEAEIKVQKILTGKTLEADMFSFELYDVTDGAEVLLDTVTNDKDGFITFKLNHLYKPGTFVYDIKEVIGDAPIPGVTYDTKTIQVTVVVTRNQGELKAEVTYPSEATFENVYAPQPVYVTLEAKKELTGKALTAGMFDFRLMTGGNASVEVVSNDGAGNITFSPLMFHTVGTYKYTIKEVVPMPDDPTITYDLKTITATIKVTDENGALKAETEYSPNQTFNNVFSYKPASATIELKKVLTGMQLVDGVFLFELTKPGDGGKIEASNQSGGKILFNIEYTEPGSYTYTIKEVIPIDPTKYLTYDTKTIEVTVDVTDDGTGKLTTTVTYPADIVFYNTYKVKGGIW